MNSIFHCRGRGGFKLDFLSENLELIMMETSSEKKGYFVIFLMRELFKNMDGGGGGVD